jgi:hypothetical protein
MAVSGNLHTLSTLLPIPIVQEVMWAPESVWTLWSWEHDDTKFETKATGEKPEGAGAV